MVLAVNDKALGKQLRNKLKSILPDYAYPEKFILEIQKKFLKNFS